MKSIFFTPGPSQLYPTYEAHLQTAMEHQLGSIYHRTKTFRDIYEHTDTQLRLLLNIPNSHSIFFASSATEIWERIILNMVDQKSFHLINGAFSQKFFNFAIQLQKNPSAFTVDYGKGFEMENLDIPKDVELICSIQNETSTGVYTSSEDLIFLKKQHPNSLICVDLVSIAPYAEIDFNFIDCAFFSVQKAFGMPPGLGVLIVNEACVQKSKSLRQKGLNIGAHHTFGNYQTNYERFETPSTPNVVAIYILGKIAADMNLKGIQNIREEIKSKANLLYSFAHKSSVFSPFVLEEKHQSDTVMVLNTPIDSAEIISNLKDYGFIIGAGYGKYINSHLRIANFPATSIQHMQDLVELLSKFSKS